MRTKILEYEKKKF